MWRLGLHRVSYSEVNGNYEARYQIARKPCDKEKRGDLVCADIRFDVQPSGKTVYITVGQHVIKDLDQVLLQHIAEKAGFQPVFLEELA